jgi:hypothetical protein
LELQQWQTGIGTVLDKAGTRLKGPAFNGCVHVRTVMAALKPADLWSDPVNPSNYLSIIRERVNIQKHAFEGFPYIVRTDATAGTWQHLLDREKMEWGRKAADVLANMYHELYQLYFDVPPVLYPPKSFKLVRS